MNGAKRFQYSLESLLRKRNWELDVQRTEESRIREVLQKQQQEKQELETYIASLEQEIRESRARDSVLEPTRYQAMIAYINGQRDLLEQKVEQVRKTGDLHDRIIEQIKTQRKSIKSLEKHKDRKKKLHEMEANKWQLAQSDELWLMHRHRIDS